MHYVNPLRNRTFVPKSTVGLDRIQYVMYAILILVRNRTSTNSTDDLLVCIVICW